MELPHFYKFISHRILQLGKLELPTQFVHKFSELSDVLLKVPTGDTWAIKLEKPDTGSLVVLLGDGLQDFMKHYSLDVGYLVTFRFKKWRQSILSVVVYDNTSAEISYPPRELPDLTSAEISYPPQELPDLPILDSAFLLKIRPSYLKRKSRVTIPHQFMEASNLKNDGPWTAWIQSEGSGKTWPMQILYRENERRGEFSNAGWHTFHREFGLREGDVCKFELTEMNKDDLFFNVSVTNR